MAFSTFTLNDDFWHNFEIQNADIEFLYNYLLELETPLSSYDLMRVLIKDRIRRERESAEKQRSEGVKHYIPKDEYKVGEELTFPALDWKTGKVTGVRVARSFNEYAFKVIEVEFAHEVKREFAAGLAEHKLNQPATVDQDDPLLNPDQIIKVYGQQLVSSLQSALQGNDGFVHIAGRWFPYALLLDVNMGNLNLAEAVLDMAGGGPLATSELLSQVDLPEGGNPKLAEFSLDLAMQEDERFDEVGSTGKVAWFLKRLEPVEVIKTPIYLQYIHQEYDRSLLGPQMIELEKRLDDEHSPLEDVVGEWFSQEVSLIYPHWRVGSVPLTPKLAHLFPTAYESPRIRFMLVDGQSGKKFPGWVVRFEKYVFGLREWYLDRGVMPGSKIVLRRGENPGEVIVDTEPHRATKEWLRTALVGADGGVVYATLKQTVETAFDDWMMVYVPSDTTALDQAWFDRQKTPPPFEQVVANTLRDLAKLNPQSHVHAAEVYSAVNVVFRCPPGPIMALLSSRPWFTHVGDLHYKFENAEGS